MCVFNSRESKDTYLFLAISGRNGVYGKRE